MRRLTICYRQLFLVLLTVFLNFTATYSQPSSGKKIAVKEALDKVSELFGTKFVYERATVRNKTTTVDVAAIKNQPLEDILKGILYPNNLLFLYVDKNHYTIVPKSSRAETTQPSTNPSVEIPVNNATITTGNNPLNIKGSVIDSLTNKPLAGVTVSLKGTSTGDVTDNSGRFSINSRSASNPVLEFTMVGYEKKQLSVEGKTNVSIVLSASASGLGEVVVVGYGTQRKKDITGSVASIRESDIKATPIVSLDRAMQGRVSGVQVTTNTGRPGGSTTIRIRGTGSVNAGNEPLYVIDGYPTGDLNSINPNDIESIDILKDASATAIYGSRGSNGVVIVTTKRGKANQSIIEFSNYYGIQSVRRKLPLLNAREYAEYLNESRVNGGSQPYFNGSNADQPLPASVGEGTDWQNEVFRKAPIQNYQLTFSGGESKTRYAISGSYYDQKGIVINSQYKRYTLRANLDRDISSWLKIGLSMQGARINSDAIRTDVDGGSLSGVTTTAVNYLPVFPVYNSNGNYFKDQTTLNPFPVDNPVAVANEIKNKFYSTRLLANTYAELTLARGLVLRSTLGGDIIDNKNNYYASRSTFISGNIGNASVFSDQFFSWLTENTLKYTRTFQQHSVTALVGYTMQESKYESVTANASNFNNDFAAYNNLGAGATLSTPASGATQWALISHLSRINYGFSNRYLLTLTARRDGSSRFGPTNKFGFFPSGAFAWRVINESFMSNQKLFQDIKFRISYGLTGNQEIGDYRFLPAFGSVSYIYGAPTGARYIGTVPGGISNQDLRWEKNAQLDIGVDIGFLNNRIRITADYYNKRTSDLLFDVNIPLTTGFSTALKNIGSVENKGWELEVSTANIDNPGFSWRTDFNIASNKNKILKLDGRPEFLSGLGSGHLQISNPILMRVGIPLGSFYGRVMDGIFQSQAEIDKSGQKSAKPGDIRYIDLNNDGVINDNDRTIIGNGYPKLIGGLNNTINIKEFEISFFFNGSYGSKILNLTRFDLYSLNGQQQAKDIVNRWTPANPSNAIPRANIAGGQKILSTFQVEDGSYLRLKNISIGYNLPQNLIKRFALSSFKIYIAAQNLLTFTKYTGFDPEVNFRGNNSISQSLDYGSYPAAKTILFGINMNF